MSPVHLVVLLQDDNSYKSPDKESSYVYGAWVMLNATKFIYFDHSERGFGKMKEGMRIASAGNFQRFASWFKNYFRGHG